MTLVDTNVLLDIATRDAHWFDWSRDMIQVADLQGGIFINAIVYAELSVRYESDALVSQFVESIGVAFFELPREAAFLAAKAFAVYRTSGGSRTGVLPDFFIGAHALVLGVPVLTRDVRRYRTYFPDLALIAPQLN